MRNPQRLRHLWGLNLINLNKRLQFALVFFQTESCTACDEFVRYTRLIDTSSIFCKFGKLSYHCGLHDTIFKGGLAHNRVYCYIVLIHRKFILHDEFLSFLCVVAIHSQLLAVSNYYYNIFYIKYQCSYCLYRVIKQINKNSLFYELIMEFSLSFLTYFS